MGYLLFILITIILAGGFIALTQFESRRGARVLGDTRTQLDKHVEHAMFIVGHVDFGLLVRSETQRLLVRMGHDIAHYSLQAVRFVERSLTRVVRYFRVRHDIESVPRESTREFVRTLSEFKSKLKTTHPDVPDVL